MMVMTRIEEEERGIERRKKRIRLPRRGGKEYGDQLCHPQFIGRAARPLTSLSAETFQIKYEQPMIPKPATTVLVFQFAGLPGGGESAHTKRQTSQHTVVQSPQWVEERLTYSPSPPTTGGRPDVFRIGKARSCSHYCGIDVEEECDW